ncbi:hypothetical protein [Amycolatopsis minnesotensis]|uniref:Uncharacterized protein n=1 Tax=Amycolatopsis minnesotensis TaxID=337894 RepID=A0ABN2RPB3_9PSEU
MADHPRRGPTPTDLVALIAVLATVVTLVALDADVAKLVSITGALSTVYALWRSGGHGPHPKGGED